VKNDNQSKVSMVMPVYNKIRYIDIMLESVYNQVWDDIELILVNDGATDGTRERLSEWLPRFRERGYEVIIVDQENQGIPGAVKSGLLRITGDYVCLVDCDDRLEPEYVSTMAGWLEGHPEDDWVVCLWNRFVIENGCLKKLHTMDVSYLPTPPNMMEKYLSARYAHAIWIYMVRADYIKKCKVVEGFITDIRATQEPGYLFPLILGGGRLKVIDRPLYNHNFHDERTSAHKSASDVVDFRNKFRDMAIKVINNLDVDDVLKSKWCIIAELAHKNDLLQSLEKITDCNDYILGFALETVRLVKTYFKPDPCITIDQILGNRYKYLASAITDCILGNKPPDILELTGRKIGCGALGKVGKYIIPDLIGTPLEPTELWDRSASPGDVVCKIPVTLPDYDTLTKEDVVLVFPKEADIKMQLEDTLRSKGAEKILFEDDINSLVIATLYPQFYNKCNLEPQPLVSVIIPVYNVEKFLKKCVDSVIKQSYQNIEIILVNDGSSDACPKICDEYAREHGNITVFHQENKGQSEARNAGLRAAVGKYVYFLDSDDYIREDAIEILLKTAEKENADVILFDAVVVDENDALYKNGEIEKRYIKDNNYPDLIPGIKMLRIMLQNNDYTCSVPLLFIKKSVLEDNNIMFYPGIIHEDELFAFHMLIAAGRALHMPEKMYFRRWRVNSTMTSGLSRKNIVGRCKAAQGIIDCCDALPESMQHKEFADNVFAILISTIKIFFVLDAIEKGYALPEIKALIQKMDKSTIIVKQNIFHPGFNQNYQNAKKIIFYGAGKKCKDMLEMLIKVNYRLPDVIWDIAGNDIAAINGITVTTPNYELLESNDDWVMVVCIADLDICDEIASAFLKYGAGKIYKWPDLYKSLLYIK
jgi:glycosyltransferase involved in cell wall biosynthesis